MGREFAPKGEARDHKMAYWKTLPTEDGASFDLDHHFDASDIRPMITYGTKPGMGIKSSETSPESDDASFIKSLHYMGLKAGSSLLHMPISHVFIGSCTNSRIEDFRAAAQYVSGKQKSPDVSALIVPGSQQVAKQIVAEGLDRVFEEAGFVLRQPGCSACLAMNDDKIPAEAYCVSTSNRNFEGRQGQGARTLLASPVTAAAAAVAGKIVDVSQQ